MTDTDDTWQAGATFVFQGSIAEDATAGTHVVTATFSPGVGNEFEVLYGHIIVGATATAQTAVVEIDDGTNLLCRVVNGENASDTVSGAVYTFPSNPLAAIVATTTFENVPAKAGWFVSGAMRVVLKVTTTAVSVTQTFAFVARVKGALPTVTINDTVGVFTPTANTNRVF